MFDVYPHIVRHVLDSEFSETNQRTGHEIKMLPYPVGFPVDLRSRRIPAPGNRRVWPATAAAETAWYLSGQQDVSWLRKHCPIWDKFVEEDGKTIKAAYGYRWREHFGRDQIQMAIDALRDDPTNRQVYVSAWDPSEDGLGTRGKKNVPCPVGFTFSLVQGALNSAILIRSSDVFVGLPYDAMGHALLMDAMAESVGAHGLGWMHITLAHPHIYDSHYEMARKSLERMWAEKPAMPGWSVEQIMADPDGYVARVKELSGEVRPHPFSVKPEVIA